MVWNASSGATGYDVKDITTGIVKRTSVTSMQVESGMPINYDDYAVRACNPYACSAWVTAQPRQVVKAPSGATTISAVSVSGTGSYTVSWGTVFNAGTYTLQESRNSGSWVTVYNGSARSKAFSGKSNASYGYRVRGCNSGGCGPWSATSTVKVATVTDVTGLTATVHYEQTNVTLAAASSSAGSEVPGAAHASSAANVPDTAGQSGDAHGNHSADTSSDVTTSLRAPPPPTYAWFLATRWNAATNVDHYEVKVTDTTSGVTSSYTATTTYLPTMEVAHSTIQVTARACSTSSCSPWSSPVTAVQQ